jgi:hypothetical protein
VELTPLRIGYSHNTMTTDERMQRESHLIATVKKQLPEFAKACAVDSDMVMLHQDSFAADYQEDEYMLLGMAIKYAGLRGKEVRVIGKNRSSLWRGIQHPLNSIGPLFKENFQTCLISLCVVKVPHETF